ncbi:unnamed protein product [Sphenostylis stenocarpa]|uniref:Uncharacterized protein n=1 Tax=Sphenostylis stenocarpa TaxID=92480 RepID=A0AA86SRB0_9FABA|nr:unnamed protein product [Sphenostylis stenocarpa]
MKHAGVRSLALDGESDEVVVTGEEVDAVCLTNQIRKKFRYATLISVENVDNGGDEGGEEEQQEEAMPNEIYIPSCPICTTSLPPSSIRDFGYENDKCRSKALKIAAAAQDENGSKDQESGDAEGEQKDETTAVETFQEPSSTSNHHFNKTKKIIRASKPYKRHQTKFKYSGLGDPTKYRRGHLTCVLEAWNTKEMEWLNLSLASQFYHFHPNFVPLQLCNPCTQIIMIKLFLVNMWSLPTYKASSFV